MNELDEKGSGYLIKGRKEMETIQVPVYAVAHEDGLNAYVVGTYPMDSGVKYVYQSRAGGFVPPSVAGDTCFSQAGHYGQGFFEGMRFYDSPYGLVLTRPWANYARFMHSATVFHPLLAKIAMEGFAGDDKLLSIRVGMPLTPKTFYDLAKSHFKDKTEMTYPLKQIHEESPFPMERRVQVPMAMKITGHDGIVSELKMRHMDAIIKTLAYTGRLVSVDHFPQNLEMTVAGYIRPFGWIAGEQGLKLPSIYWRRNGQSAIENKAMEFAVATLPWGLYLTEKDYVKGLDVMVSPYLRINDDVMPSNAKVGGNYVNSTMAINLGLMFGFGEILALNREGRFVEGSAENAFVFMEEDGKMVAYTPPVGDGCLPGTTRDGIIRTLWEMGIGVRYKSVELRHLYDAKAIVLTGTGAQMIHVRSITEMRGAAKIAEAIRLRSEDLPYMSSELQATDFRREERLINGGERHPVVAELQKRYKEWVSCEDNLEPVHAIDLQALGQVIGLPLEEFTTKRERRKIAAGYFEEPVNGLEQRDELNDKHREMARILSKGLKRMPRRGIPVRELRNPRKK